MMTKYDVVEYLTKIYNLPVREVRMEFQLGKFIRDKSISDDNHFRFAGEFYQPLDKEDDKVFANVVLVKTKKISFQFS